MTEGWTGSSRESLQSRTTEDYERELALVDRVLGLEAQLAEQSVDFGLTPSEQLRAEQQIDRMRASLGWRVGRILSAPVSKIGHRFGWRPRVF